MVAMRRLSRRLTAIALAAFFTAAVAAAPPGSGWRVEPIHGGDVRSVVFAPGDPTVALAGTSSGQVYRSDDAGETWRAAGQTFPLPGWVVATLHFDANDPGILWAGLRGMWGGGAVVRSEDLGATWHPVAQRDDGIFVLRTVPGEEGRLVLGADTGVWISADAGVTWRHASAGQSGLVEVSSLLVDPGRPERLLAGTFRRAYRSDDGGDSWYGVFDGMQLDSQVFSLQAVSSEPETYWASTCGWVYRSRDGGRSWQRFREGLAERRTPSFEVLPGRLLAGTVAGVYASLDGGRTWTLETRNDLSVLDLEHHAARPEVVLVATEGAGIWRSADGGASFRPASHGLTSPRVTALAAGSAGLRAAVSHGGPASGIYRQEGDGFVHETSGLPTVLTLSQAEGGAWAGTEAGLWELADGLWARVDALGASRVEQLLMVPEGLLARSEGALWGGPPRVWRRLPWGTTDTLSAARGHDGIWWTSAEGLYRSDGARAVSVATPVRGGQVAWAGSRLLLASSRGVWSREALEAPWVSHGDARGRLLETRDPEWPVVLVTGGRVELVGSDGRHQTVEVPVLARDLRGAAIQDGRLYLGTAGQGLLSRPLADIVERSQVAQTGPAAGAVTAPSGQ
jgi:hypothetical protein